MTRPPTKRIEAAIAAVALSLFLACDVLAASGTRTSSFDYDATSGLLTKEVIEPGDSNLCLVTTYAYDAFGNKTGATTRNCNGSSGEAPPPSGVAVIASRTSATTYDSQGRFATSATNALNHSETRVFDARFGSVTRLTGPNSLDTEWKYDGFGRKVLEKRPDGHGTKWEYLFCSGVAGGTESCPVYGKYLVRTTPVVSVDIANGTTGAANGPVSKVYYDALNREIRSETEGFDGTAVLKDTRYDSLGRVAQVSRPYYVGQSPQWTVFTYDIVNRVLSASEPSTTAGIIKTTTDYNGLTTTVTVSNNGTGANLPGGVVQTKVTTKNSQGQTVAVKDALDNTVTYGYDPFNNLLTTNAGGVTTTLGYDLRGRKTSMVDPDMGDWSYQYNALGELKWQCDPVSRALVGTQCTDIVATRMDYDKLGRMTKRTERDLVSEWFYDTQDGTPGGTACGTSKGKLCRVASDNNYQRTYAYDSAGRVSQIGTTVDAAYTIGYAYHAVYGQLETTTYPAGFVAKNGYNARGYLEKVTDNAGTTTFWQATSVSASGRILNEMLGNALTRPHAVSNVACAGAPCISAEYAYDANGNLTSAGGTIYPAAGSPVAFSRTLTYMSFNLPASLSQTQGGDSYSYTYTYNADHERVKLVTVNLAGTFTTVYLHPAGKGSLLYEKETKQASTQIEHKNFIQAGTVLVGVYITRENPETPNPATEMRYFHHDHLGSVVAITNEAGAPLERLSYETFGERRHNDGSAQDRVSPEIGVYTDRGFTSHEHLDEMNLIHMNGRIYDPALARFMTADPFIAAPDDLQAYNRYSYVNNNPFAYTDPSGYLKIFGIRITPKVVIAAVVAFVTYGAATELMAGYTAAAGGTSVFGVSTVTAANMLGISGIGASVVAGAAGGFTGGLVFSGGDFAAAFKSGLTGGIFGGVNFLAADLNPLARIAAKGLTGGVASQLEGGRFKEGFGASLFSAGSSEAYKYVTTYSPDPLPGKELPSGDGTYPESLGIVPRSYAVFGHNEPVTGNFFEDFTKQGGLLGKLANAIPILNSGAALHDSIFVREIFGMTKNMLTNFPTILPAGIVTIGANLDGPLTVQLSKTGKRR